MGFRIVATIFPFKTDRRSSSLSFFMKNALAVRSQPRCRSVGTPYVTLRLMSQGITRRLAEQASRLLHRAGQELSQLSTRTVSTPTDSQALVPAKVQNATILITSMEISRAKWPGTQLCKLFRTESLLLHLSSTTLEDPDPLGGLKFFYRSVGKNRTTMYAELAAFLAGFSVARILCVPVSERSPTAVAITDISAAPLALTH